MSFFHVLPAYDPTEDPPRGVAPLGTLPESEQVTDGLLSAIH